MGNSISTINKAAHYFCMLTTWFFILAGVAEAAWGLCQVYGFAASNHSLYALTGSFYNPDPYSGFLAMTFPVCLHEWLKRRRRKTTAAGYVALSAMALIACVLPAGMSRSAWIAGAAATAYVIGMHYQTQIHIYIRCHRKRAVAGALLATLLTVATLAGIYHIKKDSADGRLLMWKVAARAIAKQPWNGHYLFEYGHALHKLQRHDESNRILEEALRVSSDPMVMNIMAKNEQGEGRYGAAEHWLLRSTRRLPGRIYPYYLLAKLYAQPGFCRREKLEQAARVVLDKEPKVKSMAIRQMREEVKELLRDGKTGTTKKTERWEQER